MSARSRRSAVVAVAAALIAGVAAAMLVSGYTRSVERRDGERVPVAIAAAALARGEPLTVEALESAVTTRMVPRSFAAAGAFVSADEIAGMRPVADLPPGTQLTPGLFASPGAGAGFKLRRGERAVTVAARFSPDGVESAPGATVDLLAAGVGGGTGVETVVAGAEILAITDGAGGGGGESDYGGQASSQGESPPGARRGGSRLTLRVSESQAAALVRADAFAEDLRAVLRP